MNLKDLQDFAEGQTVDINGVATMQSVVITRISQSGVTIVGRECGEIIISCKSPAVLSNSQHEVKVEFDKDNNRNNVTISALHFDAETERVPRGTYTGSMDNLKFPDGLFTITQLAELNEIPYQYAANYCRANLEVAGKAPKAEGQRGKASNLYKKV